VPDFETVEIDGLPITYSISDNGGLAYPQQDTFTLQEFAGPVFEIGGYGDMGLINPYKCKRLWVGGALDDNDIYEGMRRVINVAEKLGFLGRDEEDTEVDPTATPAGPAPDGLGDPNRKSF
jgi:hypothetical protein